MNYVITHKMFDDSFLDKSNYKILHVGLNDNCKAEYLRDDTGDNISVKNPNYCELTGLYWIWKNVENDPDEIIGINHYRRYFTTRNEKRRYIIWGKMPEPLSEDIIRQKLEHNDIIVPVPERHILHSNGYSYKINHIWEDMEYVRDIISSDFPEYSRAFENMISAKYMYYGNMFICRRELFDSYLSWLFAVLSELEPQIDLSKHPTPYQSRVFGFVSERLLQVYCGKNSLKMCEMPTYNTDSRFEQTFISADKLKGIIKRATNNHEYRS